MDDLFRNLFKSRDKAYRSYQDFPFDDGVNYSETSDENFASSQNHHPSFSFGMNSKDPFFSMMEDFMSTFSQDFGHFPAFPRIERNDRFSQQEGPPQQSLRDQLLKNPEDNQSIKRSDQEGSSFSRHSPERDAEPMDSLFKGFFERSFFAPFMKSAVTKEDTDLDADVQQRGLDSIMKKDDESPPQSVVPFHGQSYHKSESRSMIRRADGSTEQRITTRSSDGTEETTVISESPSGDKRTEIRRSDGTVEVLDDETRAGENNNTLFDFSPSSTPPFHTDTMFPSVNSFIKFFFGK